MRVFRQLALVALGAVALGACSPRVASPDMAPAVPEQGEQSFPGAMSAADKAACTSSGGTAQRRGRIQAEICVRPFADAGKACSDSSQCQGKCIGNPAESEAASPVAGQCQADDRLFGCYAEIKGGKSQYAICVD